MTKKTLYFYHKWAGLTLGALLFLLGLSGIGITFRQELLPIFYSSLFKITPQEKTLSLTELYAGLAPKLKLEKKSLTNIYASETSDEAYIFLYKLEGDKFPTMMTVNPYTGAVVGEMSMLKNFFALMLFMHANLFIGKAGSYLVGILGLILIFFIISGLIIWWPQNQLWVKLQRTLDLRKGLKSKKLHHLLGVLFAIPLFISASTGFLTIFDLSYFIVRPLKSQEIRVEELERKSLCTFEDELQTLGLMTKIMEDNLISVHFCTPKNGLMKISYGLHDRDFLKGYARLVIDPVKQEILQRFDSEKDPSSWNIKRLIIFPIHTGEYFGFFGRFVNLLTGMGLVLLFVSGIVLFNTRKNRPT